MKGLLWVFVMMQSCGGNFTIPPLRTTTFSPHPSSEGTRVLASAHTSEVSIPRHRMGCPSKGLMEQNCIVTGAELGEGTAEIRMTSNTMTCCLISITTTNYPKGSYCAFKVLTPFSMKCPDEFDEVVITIEGLIMENLHYCCKPGGQVNEAVTTPSSWTGPFYLFPYDSNCQKFEGLSAEMKHVKWHSRITRVNSSSSSGYNLFKRNGDYIMLSVCSYTKHSWPTGEYFLPEPHEGCIEDVFKKMLLKDIFRENDLLNEHSDGNYRPWSVINELDSKVETQSGEMEVCVRETDSLYRHAFPRGKYCVFGKDNQSCPYNMIQEKETVDVVSEGYKHRLMTIVFCCILTGASHSPIKLPGKKSFYLLPYKTTCQQVDGMKFKTKLLRYKSIYQKLSLSPSGSHHVWLDNNNFSVQLRMCKYKQEANLFLGPLLGSIAALLVVMVVVVVCYCGRRRKKESRRKSKEASDNGTTQMAELSSTPRDIAKSKLEIGSLLKMILDSESQMTIFSLLIHSDNVETLDKIGKGAFGTVFQGRYKPDDNPLHAKDVAIKTLKDNCVYPEISAFMEEAIVMADFQHANVLTMIGVCVHPNTGVPTLVLPLMKHGDLQKYLRKFRYDEDFKDKTPELHQLLSFCLHIARGMTYLSDMKFVHRDLAARNCMLDSNMVVKVADFGLTRDIYSNSYYRQDKNKLLPIKWMAIESLQDRVFSIYTDVWSYGVTVWEIFTLGKVPYPNLENIQVLPELEKGHRLPKPDTCPDAVYELVLKCWSVNPKERPSFGEMGKTIEEALSGMSEYLDLDKTLGKPVDISSGVICSPCDLAECELQENTAKTSYVDYRETSLRAKNQQP